MASSLAAFPTRVLPWMPAPEHPIYISNHNDFRASRVSRVFLQRLFDAGEAIRLSNSKTSTLTLYSLDTLDRGKKTKGYGLPPVQGVQGSLSIQPDTLDSRPPRPPPPPDPAEPCSSRRVQAIRPHPDVWGGWPSLR